MHCQKISDLAVRHFICYAMWPCVCLSSVNTKYALISTRAQEQVLTITVVNEMIIISTALELSLLCQRAE